MKRLSMIIGLALCLALPAAAQMYKWVDANGKIQYSDKPPPSNVKTEKLRTPAQPISAPAASAPKNGEQKDTAKTGPKSVVEPEQAFRKRQTDETKAEQEQAQKEAEARERAENCRRAKAALANLELGGRQTRIDEKGERAFLSDAEIARATAQARQEAADACK
jgi:hypothetical protein